jgi:hypothetical protein
VALATHHLTPRLKEEYTYTTTPPMGRHGVFYDEFYLSRRKKQKPLLIDAELV